MIDLYKTIGLYYNILNLYVFMISVGVWECVGVGVWSGKINSKT